MLALHGTRSLTVAVRFTLLIFFLPLLAASEPPRRDAYGDPLPQGARFRLGTVRLRHDSPVTAITWLPDGRTLASADFYGTIRLRQIPNGKPIAQWDKMRAAVFSPDGRRLACDDDRAAALGESRAIRLIDVATGKELRRFRVSKTGGPLAARSLEQPGGVVSPDGKILAVVEKEGIRLYSLDNGKELHFLEGKPIEFGHGPVFSPDGRNLVAAINQGVCYWNIGTGAKCQILQDSEHTAFSFAFSADGKRIAAAVSAGSHSYITLRSWPEGKELHRLDVKDGDPRVLAFSADGKILAAGERGTIRLWNPNTGRPVRHLPGHRGEVLALAFSPDGSLLASAGSDNAVGVWEVDAKQSPRPLTGVRHRLDLLGLAGDGQTLLTRSVDDTLAVWDSRDGRHLRTLADKDGSVTNYLFGPDSGRMLTMLWQRTDIGRRYRVFPALQSRRAAFSPIASVLAVCSLESILLYNESAKSIEQRRLENPDASRHNEGESSRFLTPVQHLAFSPDGRTLAACYDDGHLILWDWRKDRPRHRLACPTHGDTYRFLQFSPDSRVLAVSDGSGIRLIETASGQQFRLLNRQRVSIKALTFAADHRTLAAASVDAPVAHSTIYEFPIRLWDLPTGKPIHLLRGHRAEARTLIFSPDGAFLYSGSDDSTVFGWDIADVMRRRSAIRKLSAARGVELWNDLAAKDAARGQRAVAELILAADSALPFLAKSMPPVSAEKMAPIVALIADLDSEEFAHRERASKELRNMGESAAPALRKVLKEKPTLEMRKRITTILDSIEQGVFSPQWLRTVRALQALEAIGTPQARQILEALSLGAPEAGLTLEAKAVLHRLDRRNSKP